MRRGEVWFAAVPDGDRPVLVLTRDPVADRIDSVVVAALTRTRRGLTSELLLTARQDGVPSDSVVNFDTIHELNHGRIRSCHISSFGATADTDPGLSPRQAHRSPDRP